VRANQAVYPVHTMCRLLEVSLSGYYAWRNREPAERARQDARLTERIRQFHEVSNGIYGAPKIHADLAEAGIRVGRKRVARLMRSAGLRGVSRRKSVQTTRRDQRNRPAPDLVERDFTASGPDQLWVADITYVPTWSGFLYLAVVLDAWSRRIVGWAMKTSLRTELVLEALGMALQQRRPVDVIHHSDQGCQYTSIAFGKRWREAGVRPSMGSVGDCFDSENGSAPTCPPTKVCSGQSESGMPIPRSTRKTRRRSARPTGDAWPATQSCSTTRPAAARRGAGFRTPAARPPSARRG